MSMQNVNRTIDTILRANPLALLTGSRALVLQGFKVKNEPGDIDIWLPDGVSFVTIPGMLHSKSNKQLSDEKKEFEALRQRNFEKNKADATPVLEKIATLLLTNAANIYTDKKLYGKVGTLFTDYQLQKFDVSQLRSEDRNSFYDELKNVLPASSLKVYIKESDLTARQPYTESKERMPVAMSTTNCELREKEDSGDDGGRTTRYMIDGVKIEIHHGDPKEERKVIPIKVATFEVNGLTATFNVSSYFDVLRAKMRYIRKGSPTAARHKDDVLFFLTANF